MHNDKPNADSPPYVAFYGMVRDPFSQTIEDDLFYPEPNRKQRLDIILHLAQYGNELMMVIGPKGSGKTTLIQQFQTKALDTWNIALIEAEGGIDERKLLQQLYHRMGLEYQGATHAELLDRMEHHLDSLQRSARQGIMIIDNAEQLPITALKKVLEITSLTNADNKPLLRIILFGTEILEEHFKDPQLGHLANIPRRSMDLPAFSEEHTMHYILHRLSAAHFAANKPFTDNAVLKIYRQSYGWPGRINDLAHDLLISTMPKKDQDSAPNFDANTFRPVRLVAALATIIAITSLLVFQNDINQWINPDKAAQSENGMTNAEKIPLPLPELKSNNITKNKVTASNVTAPMVDKEPAIKEPPSSSTITDIPEIDVVTETETGTDAKSDSTKPIQSTPTITLEKKTREENKVTGTISVTPEKPISKPIASGAPAVTTSVTTSVTTTVKPTATPPVVHPVAPPETKAAPVTTQKNVEMPKPFGDDLNISRKESWILKQNPDHYTMQVVAGEHISTIEKFIFEHKLRNNIAFYRSTRKGKTWYGLIYGSYPDKQAAIDAHARLPKKLHRLKPWIRDFKGIQQDIRKARP